jgi:hypothetical protein
MEELMEESTPPNVPFTIPERIHQLNQIDKVPFTLFHTFFFIAFTVLTISQDIVLLMTHITTALNSLTHNPQTSSTSNGTEPLSSESQIQNYESAMNSMLKTLHTVDVHMKRQIMALEEAKIIKLASTADAKITVDTDAKPLAKTSLEPNGLGAIGGLDVGWLNSRNSRVERDMEAELWGRARELLERIAAQGNGGDEGGGERMEE